MASKCRHFLQSSAALSILFKVSSILVFMVYYVNVDAIYKNPTLLIIKKGIDVHYIKRPLIKTGISTISHARHMQTWVRRTNL